MKSSRWSFLKDNKQVIYSIALMVIIPGVLIFNTWLFSDYYQEIADMTDNTLDFVKVSLHRARKALKEALLKRNFKRYEE